jgi:hypothetical protein
MEATFSLSKEDIEGMLLERWAPRTDMYLQNGVQARRRVRIKEFYLYSTGGSVSFTDEPEELEVTVKEESKVAETCSPPVTSSFDDDIPL